MCTYYHKYESARCVCAEYILKFPGEEPPSRNAIHKIINKFDSTVSIKKTSMCFKIVIGVSVWSSHSQI